MSLTRARMLEGHLHRSGYELARGPGGDVVAIVDRVHPVGVDLDAMIEHRPRVRWLQRAEAIVLVLGKSDAWAHNPHRAAVAADLRARRLAGSDRIETLVDDDEEIGLFAVSVAWAAGCEQPVPFDYHGYIIERNTHRLGGLYDPAVGDKVGIVTVPEEGTPEGDEEENSGACPCAFMQRDDAVDRFLGSAEGRQAAADLAGRRYARVGALEVVVVDVDGTPTVRTVEIAACLKDRAEYLSRGVGTRLAALRGGMPGSIGGNEGFLPKGGVARPPLRSADCEVCLRWTLELAKARMIAPPWETQTPAPMTADGICVECAADMATVLASFAAEGFTVSPAEFASWSSASTVTAWWRRTYGPETPERPQVVLATGGRPEAMRPWEDEALS